MKTKPVLKSLLALFFLLFALNAQAGEAPAPFAVDVWDPPYNQERTRTQEMYHPLDKAAKPWRICVSIPHLKDTYFLSVNYALIDEAKRLGVGMHVYEAGGYGNLKEQRRQIQECMAKGADGLILTAIQFDGLDDLIAKYADQGKPVVDLINGVNPARISARAAANFWDMGNLAGRYLVDHVAGEKETIKVGWFPGPEGAGWVTAADTGFRDAIADTPVEIVAARHGDTGRASQRKLVEEVLDAHPDLDVIAGTAVTAEAAVESLRRRGLAKKVKVLPFYYGPAVHKGIKRGHFLAAPSDLPGLQSRIAVNQLVRILEGKDYKKHVAAQVVVVDKNNIRSFDESTSLPPRGFRPIFSINEW